VSGLFRANYIRVKVIFGLTDSLLIGIAFFIAYQLRYWFNSEKVFHFLFYIDAPVFALLMLVSVLSFLALGYWFNVYEKLDSAHPSVVIRDTFRQCLLGAVSLVLAEYLLRLDLSRFFVASFATLSWVLLCLFRINAARLIGAIRKRFGTTHSVVIVGSNERARCLGEALEKSAKYGIHLTGFVSEDRGHLPLPDTQRQYSLDQLPALLRRHVVDEVIFAVDSEKLSGLENAFLLCDEEGVRTRVAVDFFPHVNSQMYLDRFGTIPLLTFGAAPHDEVRLLIKRFTDVLLSAAALLLLSPAMLLIGCLIRLTSPGPAIFRQTRCGLNGRGFTFYKFRSMCDNAEELKASMLHMNRKSTAFKIPNDPRLTPLGRLLRKFSIDEWPQLWNVLKGDMSLVGPRPAVPQEVDQYQAWHRRRLRMRPGLTCLWAVAGRDHLDFETWMKLDLEYIDNWSLDLDWNIILRTIPRVLTGKGAF